MITSIVVEIRIEYLLNTSLERYRYTNFICLCVVDNCFLSDVTRITYHWPNVETICCLLELLRTFRILYLNISSVSLSRWSETFGILRSFYTLNNRSRVNNYSDFLKTAFILDTVHLLWYYFSKHTVAETGTVSVFMQKAGKKIPVQMCPLNVVRLAQWKYDRNCNRPSSEIVNLAVRTCSNLFSHIISLRYCFCYIHTAKDILFCILYILIAHFIFSEQSLLNLLCNLSFIIVNY
jgi:hypothetical protein